MYGRMYTAVLSATSISSAAELFWVQANSLGVIIVHEIKITQEVASLNAQLPILLTRTVNSHSALGTAATPNPLVFGDAAFGGVVRTNISTISAPTFQMWREGQNVLNGWHYLPTPESRPIIAPVTVGSASGRFAVDLTTAPPVALTISGILVLEEIG